MSAQAGRPQDPKARRPYELRAEWYQVTYNLAAQYAHVVLSPPERRRRRAPGPLSAPRARERAQYDYPDDDGRAQGLSEAVGQSLSLLAMAARTIIVAPNITAGPESKRRRFAGRGRAASDVDEGAQRALLRFLAETVEPSAAVLLAGLMLYAHGPADDQPAVALDRQTVAQLDTHQASTERGPSLVAYALARDRIGYRAQYNLACYFAELSGYEHREAASTTALEWLRGGLSNAPRFEASQLASWALEDPSLEELRQMREADFYSMVRRFALPE